MKALAAGKHVLLEKPSCNTAQETRALFEKASEKGVVLLEAFHYRCGCILSGVSRRSSSLPQTCHVLRASSSCLHCSFHPVAQRLREIVRSGELGEIKSVSAALAVPSGIIAKDDIRFKWDLGGGALMDMGGALSPRRYSLAP